MTKLKELSADSDGARLIEYIKSLGSTVADFADSVGVPRQRMHYYLSSERLRPATKEMLAMKGINIFGVEPTSKVISFYEDDERGMPAHNITLPPFSDCDIAFRYRGRDMGYLHTGDWLLCKKLLPAAQIVWGELYRISTPDFTTVRRVNEHPQVGAYRLSLEGEADIEVKSSSITSLYHVRGRLGWL